MITIKKVEIFIYQLPLKQPVFLGNKQLQRREGIILRLFDSEGHWGIAEIAPLPGLSAHALPDLLAIAEESASAICGRKIPELEFFAFDEWEALTAPFPRMPAEVQWGIETAVGQIMAQRRGVPFRQWLNPTASKKIAVNAVVMDLEKNLSDFIKQWKKYGFRCLKIKVGRRPMEEEWQLLARLQELLPGQWVFRLDANKRWALSTAIQFCQGVEHFPVEYIEEPLQDVGQLKQFVQYSHIPIALDESLLSGEKIDWEDVAGIVVKPELFGSLIKLWKLVEQARRQQKTIVFSSIFHSGVGLTILAHLAAAWGSPTKAHGLGTFIYFAEDVLPFASLVKNGHILARDLDKVPFPQTSPHWQLHFHCPGGGY